MLVEELPPVPVIIILCIALYVSFESNSLDTTAPFNFLTLYVSVIAPFAPFCLTVSVPTLNVASSSYFIVYGIVDIVLVSKLIEYSVSSFIP